MLVFYVNTGRYNGAANSAFAIKQRDWVSLRGSVRHAPKGIGRFIVSGFFSCQASWLWGEHLNDAAEHHGTASHHYINTPRLIKYECSDSSSRNDDRT
ncbi:hypothetical protein [Klebsiella pneumoniae IS53]|nr:hypothetical protein [Klebsiella pneumoniae IS53]